MKTIRLVCRATDRDIFDAIVAGSKTVETRAATPRHRTVAVGDTLAFVCGSHRVEKKVKRVQHFGSIEALLAEISPVKIKPQATSAADINAMYAGFAGYKEKIDQHGLMAFWL